MPVGTAEEEHIAMRIHAEQHMKSKAGLPFVSGHIGSGENPIIGPLQVIALLCGSWLKMGKVKYIRELGDRGELLNSYCVEVLDYLQCSPSNCAYRATYANEA